MKPRLSRAARKELKDDAYLLKVWHQHHRSLLEQALAGPHGVIMQELVDFLRAMTLRSAGQLVALVQRQDWRHVDAHTRMVALHETNAAIAKLREKHGLAPYDDALPGERLTAFQILRHELGDDREAE